MPSEVLSNDHQHTITVIHLNSRDKTYNINVFKYDKYIEIFITNNITESEQHLQMIVDRESSRMGMKVNIDKTEVHIISKR